LGIQEDDDPDKQHPVRQPWDPPQPSFGCRSDSVLLKAWWPIDDTECQLQVSLLAARFPHSEPPVWRQVSDEEWKTDWRQYFTRQAYGSLTIAPPWSAQAGDLVIEPGMAFGSGSHPTTRACLSGLSRLASASQRCLDVGCGSGILALSAASLGMEAVGIDIDESAVAIARENAIRNGLDVRFESTPLDQIEGEFDLIVANIYAEVLQVLAPDLIRCCSGRLVLAGILADRQQLVLDAFSSVSVVRTEQDGEWVSLELTI